MKKFILTLLFFTIVPLSYSKTIAFELVQPKETCTVLLLQNVSKVIEQVDKTICKDAKYHYVRLEIIANDTLCKIQSYDQEGLRDFILNQDIFGVFKVEDCCFFVDVSMSNMFRSTGEKIRFKTFKKPRQDLYISFNDCYMYWKFEKINGAFALANYWSEEVFRFWYDLVPNDDCFFNYKDITIEIIDTEGSDDY